MKNRRTRKQRIIMGLVLSAADAGELLNIQELHKRLPYKCSYGSFRTSLKFLEEGGSLLRERAGHHVILRPTLDAYHRFRSSRMI
jgi:hypothetical protein